MDPQIYSQLLKCVRPTISLTRLRGLLIYPDHEAPVVIDAKHPDPGTFEGFLAYCKTVRSAKNPNEVDSVKSTETFSEVQAFLDTRRDFEVKDELSASPSPSPPPM